MRIAVTGAGGFLGSELLRVLAARGDEVLAASSRSLEGAAKAFAPHMLQVVAPSDFLDEAAILDGCDAVLHCAFPRTSDADALAQGLDFSRAVFRAAQRVGVAVVNVSSQSVYDATRTVAATEDMLPKPEGPYAIAKLASEEALGEECGAVPHTSVRMASLIGPGFDQRVVNRLVRQALGGETLRVLEAGRQFSFLDVSDAADGLVAMAAGNPRFWKPVYNLGRQDGFTLTDMVGSVQRVFLAEGLGTVRAVIDDRVQRSCCTSAVDATLFSRDFGWRPCLSLDDSIALIASCFRSTA